MPCRQHQGSSPNGACHGTPLVSERGKTEEAVCKACTSVVIPLRSSRAMTALCGCLARLSSSAITSTLQSEAKAPQ